MYTVDNHDDEKVSLSVELHQRVRAPAIALPGLATGLEAHG